MDSTPPLPPPDATSTPTLPGTAGAYQRPADYYAAPPPEPGSKSGCPRWLIFGCGGLGCLAIVMIFVLGWFGMRAGGGALFGWVFSQIEEQSGQMMASDVTAEQRSAFNHEFARMKNHTKQRRLGLKDLQSVLSAFQSATKDQTLSAAEVQDLTRAMKDLNDRAEGGATRAPGISVRSRLRPDPLSIFWFS